MMKTNLTLAASLSIMGLVASHPAGAGILDDAGTWEGTGTVSEASGRDLGAFTVSLTRKSVGAAKVRQDGRIVLAGGREVVFWQEFEGRGPNAFDIVSNHGAGSGQCFANGMCRTFEQAADGHAFWTIIATDGVGRVRVLVTEIEGGQPVRFVQQVLKKKP